MSIRDEEIKRLVKYAQGLGVKVTWARRGKGDPGASWATDGSEIIIHVRSRESKIQIILNFIHELAHHMAWVYNGRKVDLKTDQALENHDSHDHPHPPIPKGQRKLIYLSEKNDSEYQYLIAKELGLRIPTERLKAEIELDLWIYRRYYLTGKYPTIREIKQRRKEIKKKHGIKK